MLTMQDILKKTTVMPVMIIEDLDDAVPLASALIDGGMNVLEITLRSEVAIDAVKAIKSALPEAIVGTGTVIDMKTFKASQDACVDFMVSPGITNNLLNLTISEGVNLLPGVSTPSEAMNLLEVGYNCMKFFPAEASGGLAMLKAISGPLPQITFCPTGGISMANAADYLSLSNVACVGGSWMLDKQLIKEKNWSEITRITRAIYSELVITNL